MSVSVIIAAYARPDNLRFVLLALTRQTVLPDEVIIADDGSDPPLCDALGDLRGDLRGDLPFPVTHVWQPDEGFRAARSRNNAIFRACHDRLVFLDHDVLPHASLLAVHLRYGGPGRVTLARILPLSEETSRRLTPEAVLSGVFETRHEPGAERRLRRQQSKYRLYALMRRLGLPFKKTRPSLSSGNISAWKPDLERVNGFDEAYVGWGQEDDDLGRRLYMAGVRPVPLLTTARAAHLYHPIHRPDWRSGPNILRYRAGLSSCRCEVGLDAHPHPDVRTTVFGRQARHDPESPVPST